MKETVAGRGAFLRFVGVGALNTLLTYALYFALSHAMHYQVAYAIAYLAGVILQFVLHSRFVYGVPLRWANLFGYPPIHLVLYGFGALLLRLLVEGFEFEERTAPLVVIALSLPLSFLLTRAWLTREATGGALALRLVDIGLALGIATFAAVYAIVSISYLWAYSWRQLLFDQVRQYLPLLEGSFPSNLLLLENGHRPIFPNLIRYADIVFGSADQRISIVAGLLLTAASLTLIVVAAARTRTLSLSERAAAILLAAIAIYWLGNARMLLHANESIQVALATFAVVLMGLFAWRAGRQRAVAELERKSAFALARSTPRELAWMLAAATAAFVATFSFGSGIAAFPALLVLALMQRTSRNSLLLVSGVMLGTLALYLFVLPGDEGVRGALAVRPVDSLLVAARWLSSPMINGWLGLADPAAGAWVRGNVEAHGVGAWLVASADSLSAHFGTRRFIEYAGMVIGLIGLAATAAFTLGALRRSRALGALEALAFALALFGAATGLLIGLARLSYFDQHPLQILADRYGVWPCLMWLGLGLLVLLRFSVHLRRRASRDAPTHPAPNGLTWQCVFVPLLIVAVGALSWPSHLGYRGWGMVVYRNSERGAAGIALGVSDPAYGPSHGVSERQFEQRVMAALKSRKLSMFAPQSVDWVGKTLPAPVADALDVQPARVIAEPAEDLNGNRVVSFRGNVFERRRSRRLRELVVIDAGRRVVGIAHWSADWRNIGLVIRARWTDFDGYARVPADCAPLTLVGINANGAERMAQFDPCPGKPL